VSTSHTMQIAHIRTLSRSTGYRRERPTTIALRAAYHTTFALERQRRLEARCGVVLEHHRSYMPDW
jgi:hypothetical protein